MPRHCARWRLALLLTGGFVLALAGSLAACGGSSDGDPPPVAPAEQPAAATTTPSAETVPTSAATPELPVAPVEPPAEGETAPIATATPESAAASAETPAPDPPTPPARVAPEPATGPAELPAEVSTSPAETTSAESVTSPHTPAPHPGVALIEPAPGTFEHRTFETGEDIDRPRGIYVLDPETGRTEGYTLAGGQRDEEPYDRKTGYSSPSSDWILAVRSYPYRPHGQQPDESLLLHRKTGQSWRWPTDHLRLAAASSEHLLFEERTRSGDGRSTGRFTLVNRAMEAVGHFSIDGSSYSYYNIRFSPDGRTIALSRAGTVYLVPVETAQPAVLLAADATAGRTRAWLGNWYDGSDIRVTARYENASGEAHLEWHSFSWEGALLPGTACQGQISLDSRFAARISPDGRYVAWLDGGDVSRSHAGVQIREDPWPSVVIAEADTCAPLFRVRSAYTYELAWQADWLPTSDGFVIGVRDGGYMIARIRPTPSLVRLPDRGAGPANPAGSGGASHHFFYITVQRAGPEPAPTGDGRYFAYGPSVYDAFEDRWVGPEIGDPDPYWWWGDSHRERWFARFWEGHGWYRWLLLPPKIEFPPFSDEIAFRVAGTGSCLRLREAPGEDSETQDCLPDGTRLVLSEPNASSHDPEQLWPTQPHPAVAWTQPEGGSQSTWVHVRTADGAEGWVSQDYLEHD